MSSWDTDLTFLSLFPVLDCARLKWWHPSSQTCLGDTPRLTCPSLPDPLLPRSLPLPSHPRFIKSAQLLKPKTKTCCHSSYLTSDPPALLTLPPQFIWSLSSPHAHCHHPPSGCGHIWLGQLLCALFDLNVTCNPDPPAIVSVISLLSKMLK